MRWSQTPNRVALLVIAIAFGTFGCDSITGSGGINIAGSWSGVASFPSGFSTSMTLQQNGTAISGQMRTTAGFAGGLPIIGDLNSDDRTFTWSVGRTCETWSGTLTISDDENEMTGPILVDRSGCQGQSNANGSLRLTRQ